MSDFQILFLIVCAMYLLECVLWLRGGVIVFRRSLLGQWRVLRRGWELAAFDTQAFLAPLFPPFGRVLICEHPRLRISPHVFWLDSSHRAIGQNLLKKSYFPFDSIIEINYSGTKVICDGEAVVRLSSPAAARLMADLLARLKRSSAAERAELLEAEFCRVLDTDRVREVLSVCYGTGRALRRACNLEFAVLFVAFPLLGQQFGFRMIWLPLLVCFVSIGLYISWQFYQARSALYSNDPDRGSTTATLLLSPVSAVRAVDKFEKDAIGTFHPLAVAAVLCSPELFNAEASRNLRELMFPLPLIGPESLNKHTAAEAWFRAHWQKAVEQFIERNIGDPARLLTAPPKESDECRSYCPRCCGQYVFEAGKCAECELPVVSFDKPTAMATPLKAH